MAYCSLPGRSPRLARLVSTRSSMMLGGGAALVLMWRVLTTWTPAVESGGGPTVSPEALERVDRASSQTDISPVEVSRSLAVDNLNLEVLDSLAVRSRPREVLLNLDDFVVAIDSSGGTPFWQQVPGIGLVVLIAAALVTGFFVRRSVRNESDRNERAR